MNLNERAEKLVENVGIWESEKRDLIPRLVKELRVVQAEQREKDARILDGVVMQTIERHHAQKAILEQEEGE